MTISPRKISEFYEGRAVTYKPTDEEGCRRYKVAVSLACFGEDNFVLDVGCKVALLPDMLSQRLIPCHYFGTDLSSIVQRLPKRESVRLLQADVSHGLPFQDNVFTHVFCLELLEHVVSPFAVLEEIHRVLRPGGELLLSVPNPYYWAEVYGNLRSASDTEGHISSFTYQNIQRLFDFVGFGIRARRGTYLRLPFSRSLRSSLLLDIKPWLFARSVVYAAAKGHGRESSAG